MKYYINLVLKSGKCLQFNEKYDKIEEAKEEIEKIKEDEWIKFSNQFYEHDSISYFYIDFK